MQYYLKLLDAVSRVFIVNQLDAAMTFTFLFFLFWILMEFLEIEKLKMLGIYVLSMGKNLKGLVFNCRFNIC